MPLLPSHTLLQLYSLTLVGSSYLLLFSPLSLLNSSPLWLLGESMHVRRASFLPAAPGSGMDNPSASAPGVTLHGKQSLVSSVLGGNSLLGTDIREILALLGFTLFVAAVSQAIFATPLRYSKDALLSLAHKSRSSRQGIYQDLGAVSELAEKVHTLHTSQTLFLTLAAVRVLVEGGLVAYIYLAYSDRKHGHFGASMSTEMNRTGEGLMGLLANRVVFAGAMGDMLFWGYIWTVLRDEARDVAEVVARRRQMEEDDNKE